ncbi:hypothetical protein KW882_05165 [Vibrio parahaemolyticus]
MSTIANSLSAAEQIEYIRHSEHISRMATLFSNTEKAKKYLLDKGIEAEKLSQEEIARQALQKDLFNSELPTGYLSTSEELAAKQLSKRAVDASFMDIPDFKESKLSSQISFRDDIGSGRSSVELADSFKDFNFGKTLGFIARQSLGYGLATMTGGMSVALVSNPIVSYAIYSAVKASIFKVLEFSGVLTSLKNAFAGFLKNVSKVLGFDKLSEKHPTLGKGAKLLAIGTAVTAAVIALSSDANAEITSSSAPTTNKSLQALKAFEEGIEQSVSAPVKDLPEAAKHLAESAEAPKSFVQIIQNEVTEKMSSGVSVVFGDAPEVSGDSLGQNGVLSQPDLGSKGVEVEPEIPAHLTGNFSSDAKDYSLSSRLDSIRESTQAGKIFDKLGQEGYDNSFKVPFRVEAEQLVGGDQDLGQQTVEASVAESEVAPFDISKTESVQIEIKSGSSVWKTYENYLDSSGINFENEAQKNKAMVHIMQEIARINPDLESVHQIQAGQVLSFPKVETLEQALSATQTIDVTAENNVLSNHAPSEGMIEAAKSKSAPVIDIVGTHASEVDTQQQVAGKAFGGKVDWVVIDKEGFTGLTGDSGSFLMFEDSPQEKIRTVAENISNKLYDSEDYSLIEKEYVTGKIEAEILSQNSLAVTDKGFLKVPTNFNDVHFAEMASGVNDHYIGEYVTEHAKTYTESNYQMDNKGVVHMTSDKSIEQVSATIALEMSKRDDMTADQIGKLYGEIVESIKLENGVQGNDVPLDKFKIPNELQTEIKNERLLKCTDVYSPHERPKFR